MKKVILLSALVLTGFGAFAGESPASVKEKVKKGISYPSHLKEKNEDAQVRVSFSISEEGRVQICEINTGDAKMKKHVENTLGMMTFEKGSFEPGKVMNLSISFRIY